MKIWQPLMIGLARNQSIKKTIQSLKTFSRLAGRFIGGENVAEAVITASALKQKHLSSSLFYLGEYVKDRSLIKATVQQLERLIAMLAEKSLEIHVSVDPTQVGLQIDKELCRENINALSLAVTDWCTADQSCRLNRLMLDMEDSSVVDFTFSLYKQLVNANQKAAITLQAYLYRTEQDLREAILAGGTVRLVKGAFAESNQVAFTGKKDIDEKFLSFSRQMLSKTARKSGFYPVFGTHDDKLIEKIIKIAADKGWPKKCYEFEMLYGVREDLQQSLVSKEVQLRLYLPFGSDWWPYVARRIGESPKNLMFLLKALQIF